MESKQMGLVVLESGFFLRGVEGSVLAGNNHSKIKVIYGGSRLMTAGSHRWLPLSARRAPPSGSR